MENNLKATQRNTKAEDNHAYEYYENATVNEKKKKIINMGCVFVKIFKVDTVNENYSAEIFLESRWREEKLDNINVIENIDLSKFWNPKLRVENILSENKIALSIMVHKTESGMAYLVEKRLIKGSFNEILELKHFPFDCQDLSITISSEFSAEDVDIIEAPKEMININAVGSMESQEWSLYSHVEASSMKIKNECSSKEIPIITFTCRASRKYLYFLINHFLISSMFFLLTFTSFGIIPSFTPNIYGRLQLCMTCLLTSVTFKVAVSQNLPRIPYLTYLDKTILGNIFMIMCVCMWHAGTSFINVQEAGMVLYQRNIEVALIPSLLCFYILAVVGFGLIIYFDAGSRRRSMASKDIEFEKAKKKHLGNSAKDNFLNIC